MVSQYTYHDFEQLASDAAWLLEELDVLKRMLPVIPYHERPMGQESVLDMIAKIGYVTEVYYRPALQFFVNHNAKLHYTSIEEALKFFSDQYYRDSEPNALLDRLISNRKELLDFLSQIKKDQFNHRIHMDGRVWSLAELVHEMVRFDRQQLKQVAERVLDMQTDRQV